MLMNSAAAWTKVNMTMLIGSVLEFVVSGGVARNVIKRKVAGNFCTVNIVFVL